MRLSELFNNHLDSLIRPAIHLRGRPWSMYQVCGYIGLALAVLLSTVLVTHRGLSPWVMAAIDIAAVLTFFGLAMLTKIVVGEERLIYYHHEIAVLTVAAALLWLLGQPVLAYLDATLLGVGMFLACGRVGCLMVGCCHGRPHHWGVRYRDDHVAVGFTPYFAGVRLFPIQAVESLWVLCIVAVGSALVLGGHPPGAALAWYVITYDAGRFCFEFARGDPDRPYRWGFSEAQWISVALAWAVVAGELSGVLTLHPWHAGVAASLVLAMLSVAIRRRVGGESTYQLLHPHHVREVAEAIERASGAARAWETRSEQPPIAANIYVGATSLGIQISAGAIEGAAGRISHYALSRRGEHMSEATAKALATSIVQLKHSCGSNELVQGNQGVFHLLIHKQEMR